MDYVKDPRVDAYIDPLPAWQQALCQRLRDIVHAADPDVAETIKRTVQPYFVLDGNVCALLATKDHINLFVYDGTSFLGTGRLWGTAGSQVFARSIPSNPTGPNIGSHTHAVGNQGSGTAMSLMQPYRAINFIVRAY